MRTVAGHKRLLRCSCTILAALIQGSIALLAVSTAARAGTLETIQARGSIVCGVESDLPGFSLSTAKGWSGLGVDFCRALAAAVLGKATAVTFVPLTQGDQFAALKSGAVDLLPSSAVWSLSHEAEIGVRFAGVLFYDGQGFMVRKGDAVASILELSGATICVTTGTRAETSVTDYFKSRKMKYQLVVGQNQSEIVKAYSGGSCTVVTGDTTQLALERSRLPRPTDHFLLPETATKEPIGPAVRQGDEVWFNVVRWLLMALIAAEEQGVQSTNVEVMRNSVLQDVRRLLGVNGGLGQSLGLAPEWAYEAIRQAGNYGEMFDRTVGSQSVLKLERGLNALWTKGGLMYSAPLR